ncbi:XylR N-terminal domain-containing protein [Haloglomus halophilum]|jgi:predicted hydrocarbon binding protein|uniref:XylR N-terminal domain-containing protein n=1 Tax=Haloglomus halophilum TaxID=2962672 RepID=UPI0020C9D9AA|nr:XylR N-terminal domain-containing protein [Haloglomus halophilum]
MHADDFDLEEDLEYGSADGVNSFRNNRMLIFNAKSMGLLRQQLIDTLGVEEARKTLFRSGYQSGYADYLSIEKNYDFESPEELLKAGPRIHTDKGIVGVETDEIEYDRENGEFYFSGTWHNSFEAQQHIIHNGEANDPVCWNLIGYASSWCSGFAQTPVLAMEHQCAGMGADVCKWEVKPIDEWDEKAEPYIRAIMDFFKGEKLMEYYSYIEEQEGLEGKIQLAKETNLPETKASTAVDSKENIKMFRQAIEDILGERPPKL